MYVRYAAFSSTRNRQTHSSLQGDAPVAVVWVLRVLLLETFKNVGETFLS